MRSKYPAYNKALKQYIDGNFKYFNRYRKSVELSYTERRLLEVRHLFISQDWDGARNLLLTISTTCDFLTADKYFLLAFCYTMKANHPQSIRALRTAISAYASCDDRRGRYLSYYNQAVDFSRMGLRAKTKECLEQAYNFAKFPGEKRGILRAQAVEESTDLNFGKAIAKIEQAFALDLGERDVNELDRNVLESVAADIYFRNGDYDKVEELLNKLKGRKSNCLRGRISFEIYVFNAFKNEQQLGQMPMGVKNSEEHTLKWQILKHVESGDFKSANKKWDKLCQMFPHIYTDGFKCRNLSDEKSLFYCYLKRYLKQERFDQTIFKQLNGPNLKSLYRLLAMSPTPLRKEQIIEHIWGEYGPEYNNRFYLLVKRLKSELGGSVVKFNSSYALNKCA